MLIICETTLLCQGWNNSFKLEKFLFARWTRYKSAYRTVAAEHPMTGEENTDRVTTDRHPDRSCCARPADFFGD
jgi:hypothetical protein